MRRVLVPVLATAVAALDLSATHLFDAASGDAIPTVQPARNLTP